VGIFEAVPAAILMPHRWSPASAKSAAARAIVGKAPRIAGIYGNPGIVDSVTYRF
jgi:hypothetical protein